MLCVKTKLKESKIDGIGLFSDEDIKRGTIVWKTNDEVSFNKYSKEEWNQLKKRLSKECFKQIKKYSYMHDYDGCWRIDLDDARFINHSENPNTVISRNKNLITTRLIKKGEEILINYKKEYIR